MAVSFGPNIKGNHAPGERVENSLRSKVVPAFDSDTRTFGVWGFVLRSKPGWRRPAVALPGLGLIEPLRPDKIKIYLRGHFQQYYRLKIDVMDIIMDNIRIETRLSHRRCPEVVTINLSDVYDDKLKTLAAKNPFVTRESVIERLIDDAVASNRDTFDGNGHAVAATEDLLRQDPDRHASLDHTRIISAILNGREIDRPKWNTVYNEVHVAARQRLGSFENVKNASRANLRAGRYEHEGYKPLPGTDFSIQGVSANLAWMHSLTLSRTLKIPIKVVFEWRDKEGAAHPGKRGVLEWKPSES